MIVIWDRISNLFRVECNTYSRFPLFVPSVIASLFHPMFSCLEPGWNAIICCASCNSNIHTLHSPIVACLDHLLVQMVCQGLRITVNRVILAFKYMFFFRAIVKTLNILLRRPVENTTNGAIIISTIPCSMSMFTFT